MKLLINMVKMYFYLLYLLLRISINFFSLLFFIIYSRYLKRVISKRDGCVYLKQVPSSDGSLELI
jgi:hypothetical protein